jgi:hypothetical protein
VSENEYTTHHNLNTGRAVTNNGDALARQLDIPIPVEIVKPRALERVTAGKVGHLALGEGAGGGDQDLGFNVGKRPGGVVTDGDDVHLPRDVPARADVLGVEQELGAEVVLVDQALPVGKYVGLEGVQLVPVGVEVVAERVQVDRNIHAWGQL